MSEEGVQKPVAEKKKTEPGRGIAVKVFYPIIYAVLWLFLRFYHWPTFKGRKNLPKGPCIICGNHSGLADPLWFLLLLRERFPPWTMAKNTLFEKKPWISRFLMAFRAFPVNRGANDIGAIKKSLTVLKKGEKLLIFPEGTRVKPGMTVEPKSGAVLLAERAGVPIVPVYITPNRKPFRPIRVLLGEPWTPEFSSRRPDNDELTAVTAVLMEKIYGLPEHFKR